MSGYQGRCITIDDGSAGFVANGARRPEVFNPAQARHPPGTVFAVDGLVNFDSQFLPMMHQRGRVASPEADHLMEEDAAGGGNAQQE